MEAIQEGLGVFLAISPLHEAVLKLTSRRSKLSKLEYRVRIAKAHLVCINKFVEVIESTFNGSVGETCYFLRPRLAHKNTLVVWKSLWVLHITLNEGDGVVTAQALAGDIPRLQAVHSRFQSMCEDTLTKPPWMAANLAAYSKYLIIRIQEILRRNTDFCMERQDSPDYRYGDIVTFLQDGIFDLLFSLITPLTLFKFYVDDFGEAAVLQSAQVICDDFIYLYKCITNLMLNLFMATKPLESMVKVEVTGILSRYSLIHEKMSEFMSILSRMEVILDRRIPTLIPLPPLNSLF